MASAAFISWIYYFWARFWPYFNFVDFRAYFGPFSSAFLSNCLSVLVHLSSRRSSWYHTGLISSFRGSVGMEWMWWSSLVNGQQSSKSTFGPNNVFCASLESPNLFCLIPEGICSTTTHLIRCRLGSILQSLLVPKSLQRLRSIYTRNRGR